MYIIRLMIIMISSIFLTACATKNTNLDNTGSNTVDSSYSKDNIVIIKKKTKSTVKNNSPDFKKSVILKQELAKCGVKYIPWSDRIKNDLILMPKIVKVCKKTKLNLNGYILHSRRKKLEKGFVLNDKHLFIPYFWNEDQISAALTHILVKQK